jgi:prepilin-type N-terminal cleavage/methylation domain-containing protein
MKRSGFTLVEMAIVVLLAGILMTFGVGMLSAQLDNAAITVTKKRQEAIRDALAAYLAANKRLPCPDYPSATAPNIAFDGIEDRVNATAGTPPRPDTTTACAASFGTLPYLTLGLSRDSVQDGWNNLFSYHVSTTPYNWTLNASFNAGSQGGITVNGRDGAGTLSAITGNAVAMLVSHGKNGLGAYTLKGSRNVLPITTDELENTNGDAMYIKRDYTDNAAASGGAFDDVVLVVSSNDLIDQALQNKSVKSFAEEVNIAVSDIGNIKNALIGYAMKNNKLPYADSDGSGKPGCSTITGVNDGIADAGCTSGNVPWVTLGVAANDPWAISAPPASIAVPNHYRYRVTPALTTTADKAGFVAAVGTLVVNNEAGTAIVNDAPFVVYSLGRNNVAYFNNTSGVGAPCASVAGATPLTPTAPACLGTNEVSNLAATGSFVKAPLSVPPFTNPQTGYDDIVDYVPKGAIDAKLP